MTRASRPAFLRSCLERYGPAFTLSFSGEGPAVWLAEPDDVRAVFSAAPGTADAGAVNWQLAPALGARSVLLLDGSEHLDVRRMLSGPFHGARLARWADLGVTEVLFGLPDKPEAEVAAYVERLAGKLAALV